MAVAAVVATSLAAGCSGDEPEAAPSTTTSDSPEASTGATPDLERRPLPSAAWHVVLRAGTQVPKARRSAIASGASAPVRAWVQGAFLDRPRGTKAVRRAFGGWTSEATRQALRAPRATTVAALGSRVEEVGVRRRDLIIYLFAPNGRPAGATGRLSLFLVGRTQDGQRIRARVSGALRLTKTGHGWKVYAYDLSRSTR